jgi:hypothetical protein
VVGLQQPPLHACDPLHVSAHWWVVVLQERPATFNAGSAGRHSEVWVQPHPNTGELPRHWLPLRLLVQSAQAPDPPQAVCESPLTQWPPEQQLPPLQVPLARPPHASVHMPETQLGVPPLQPTQTPELPHAPLLVPAMQVPLVMPLGIAQQPPLQGFAAEQAVVHRWETVLQVAAPLQSLVPLQPQWPPPLTAMHSLPSDDAVQAAQTPPVEPQAFIAVPAAQVPLVCPLGMLQQPPLQGRVAVQVVVHFEVSGSHAEPAGHSLELAQPQLPSVRQAWPLASALQSMHIEPPTSAPQLVGPLP